MNKRERYFTRPEFVSGLLNFHQISLKVIWFRRCYTVAFEQQVMGKGKKNKI